MVVPISDIDVSRFVDRNRYRLVEARSSTSAISFAFFNIASECAGIPVRGNHTDGVVAAIAHVHVPASINREAVGTIELSDLPVTVGQTCLAGSRKRLDPNDRHLGGRKVRTRRHQDGS